MNGFPPVEWSAPKVDVRTGQAVITGTLQFYVNITLAPNAQTLEHLLVFAGLAQEELSYILREASERIARESV